MRGSRRPHGAAIGSLRGVRTRRTTVLPRSVGPRAERLVDFEHRTAATRRMPCSNPFLLAGHRVPSPAVGPRGRQGGEKGSRAHTTADRGHGRRRRRSVLGRRRSAESPRRRDEPSVSPSERPEALRGPSRRPRNSSRRAEGLVRRTARWRSTDPRIASPSPRLGAADPAPRRMAPGHEEGAPEGPFSQGRSCVALTWS